MSNISSQYMIPAANKQQVSFNSEDVSSEMNSLNRLCRDIYNAIHHLFTGSKRPDVEQHLRVFVNAKNDSYARSEAFAKLVMLAAPDCLTEEIPASVSAVYSISQQSIGEKVSYTLKMKPGFVQQKNGNNQNQNASGLEYELKFSDENPLGLDLDSECAKVILAMCADAGAAKAVSTKDGPVFNKALDIISNPSGHTIPKIEEACRVVLTDANLLSDKESRSFFDVAMYLKASQSAPDQKLTKWASTYLENNQNSFSTEEKNQQVQNAKFVLYMSQSHTQQQLLDASRIILDNGESLKESAAGHEYIRQALVHVKKRKDEVPIDKQTNENNEDDRALFAVAPQYIKRNRTPYNEDFTLKEEPHSTAALTSTKKVTNKSTQEKINAEINKAKYILDSPKLQDESGILSEETEKAIRTVLVHIGSKSSLSSDDDMYCRKACLQALYFLGLSYSRFDADSKEQSKARYADLIGLVSNCMNKNEHLFSQDEIDAIKTTKPTDIKTTKPTDTN